MRKIIFYHEDNDKQFLSLILKNLSAQYSVDRRKCSHNCRLRSRFIHSRINRTANGSIARYYFSIQRTLSSFETTQYWCFRYLYCQFRQRRFTQNAGRYSRACDHLRYVRERLRHLFQQEWLCHFNIASAGDAKLYRSNHWAAGAGFFAGGALPLLSLIHIWRCRR